MLSELSAMQYRRGNLKQYMVLMKTYAVSSYLEDNSRLGYPKQILPPFRVDDCRKRTVSLEICKRCLLKQ